MRAVRAAAALLEDPAFRCHTCADNVRVRRGCPKPLRDPGVRHPEPPNPTDCARLDVPRWVEELYVTRSRILSGLIRPPELSAADEELLALLDTELRLHGPANEARAADAARERRGAIRNAFARHWGET